MGFPKERALPAVVRGSLAERIRLAISDIDELNRRVTVRASDRLVELAREFCPVAVHDEDSDRHHHLRDTIVRRRIRKTAGGYTGGAETDDPIAPFVEWDTRPHLIEPVRAQALHFRMGGREVFAKRVRHPGTKGAHFMARAAHQLEAEIDEMMDEELRRWAREAGL